MNHLCITNYVERTAAGFQNVEMAGKIDVDTDRHMNTCTYNTYIIYRLS